MKKSSSDNNPVELPVIALTREQLNATSKYIITADEIKSFAGSVSIGITELMRMAKSAVQAEVETIQSLPGNLYKCEFPDGLSKAAELMRSREEDAYLGAIRENGRIVKQARWKKFNQEEVKTTASVSIPSRFNPTVIAITAIMQGINEKLDDIQETQEEIIQFLHNDKESELEGSVNSLADILTNYRFNSDNDIWKGSQLTVASTIKGKAEHNIVFYRKCINDSLGNKRIFHMAKDIKKAYDNISRYFKNYQIALFLYEYAYWAEILLSRNFEGDYLKKVLEKLYDYSMQYRDDYSECFSQLEKYSKSSVETLAVTALGSASKFLGNTVAKIPKINKKQLDENLIITGESILGMADSLTEKLMAEFSEHGDLSASHYFIDSLTELNNMCNKPFEIYFDEEKIYICH
ncbi:MAG: hypothetical protein IKI78_01290 [Clostridia bacterium]|nr:hypothetical protein [Clostridia bacterium]